LKHILIVDDDADVLFVLKHILLSAGYVAHAAPSAAAARRELYERSFDLVLADGKLEDGTGFEVADLGVAQGAKALIVTGYAPAFSPDELDRYPYLTKPIRAPEILSAVEQAVGSAEIANERR
jgi:two-component system, NtrC family, response regulator HydG